MRIAKQSDAVGREQNGLRDGGVNGMDALQGQAIKQIEIDGCDARFMQQADRARHGVEGLDAVHSLLHLRIEILHAQTGTVDAPSGIGANLIGIEMARVELQRTCGTCDEIKGLVQPRHDLVELTARQAVGRATAKVQMRDLWPPCQVAFDQPDFFQQVFEKQLDGPLAFDNMGVATAIPAQLVAEGHMHIERNRLLQINGFKPCLECRRADARVKMRRGRVARITRHAGVEKGKP